VTAVKIEQSTHNDFVLLFLHGDLDLTTVPLVRHTLAKQLAEQPPAIICDLAGVPTLDPLGMAVFASPRHPGLEWPGTRLVLCGARPAVKAVLTRQEVPLYLPVYDTLQDAIHHALHRPPHRRDQLSLPPTPAAVAQARAFAVETCKRWDLAELADSADVVVNELVTNAVVHASTPLTVRLELLGYLTIAVHDHSPAGPRPLQQVAGQREHGLALVVNRAKAWGCRKEQDGKVIWCALDAP
jgi:anti-anti-sigma factor